MTKEETKAINYLLILELIPTHFVTRLELKEQFLSLSSKYDNLDNDSKIYFKIKEAYDYLYDHIELLNEAIHNKLNPEEETHNHSFYYEEEKKVEEKPHLNNDVRNETPVSGNLATNPNDMPLIQDRPSLFMLILSLVSPLLGFLFFFITKKVTPKSSWLYLIFGIISLGLSYFLLMKLMG